MNSLFVAKCQFVTLYLLCVSSTYPNVYQTYWYIKLYPIHRQFLSVTHNSSIKFWMKTPPLARLLFSQEWLKFSSWVVKTGTGGCKVAQVTLNMPGIVLKPGLGMVLVFTRNAHRLPPACANTLDGVNWSVSPPIHSPPLLLSQSCHMFWWCGMGVWSSKMLHRNYRP